MFKNFLFIVFFIFIILIAFNFNILNFTEKKLSVEDAVNKGFIKVEVEGKGGYSGYCTKLLISSLLNHDTIIHIEAGRRLNSVDSAVQDILIVKDTFLLVKARNFINTELYGFCCQASNKAPSIKEKFEIGHLADSNLNKLAVFFSENNYDDNITQNAIWVVSDNHPLSSVGSSTYHKSKEIKKLHNFIATLKHLPEEFSWYFLTFKNDTTRLFSGIPDSLYADFEYNIWNNSNVSITLSDSVGHVVKRFMTNKPHNPDKYIYYIKTSVFGYPKGKYFVRLFSDNQLKIEKAISL